MDQGYRDDDQGILILSADGDYTIRDGDRLRLWKHIGIGFAHEVFLGVGGTLYDNSGPGGNVRRTNTREVLCQYKVIEIVSRSTPVELARRIAEAEQRIGTPWSGFYTCQDFTSEIFTGKPGSFQRDAIVGLAAGAGLLWLLGNNE